jgi:hypothetical protein
VRKETIDVNKPNGFTGRVRLAAAAVVSAGLLIPLAAFGASGAGQSSSAAAQYKITICHHTHSKKHPTRTIKVSVNAWKAHAKHGDTMGACAPAAAPSKKANGHSESKPAAASNSEAKPAAATNGKAKGHGK